MSKNLKALMSSESVEWETPQEFFDKLNEEFNFTLDPCANKKTAKCKKFYTKKDDGLSKDWSGEVVFCNPPYGTEIKNWVEKCYNEGKKGDAVVVMLIPARTDTQYFHKFIYRKSRLRFIKGRLKFAGGGEKGSAPFPSMMVIFK